MKGSRLSHRLLQFDEHLESVRRVPPHSAPHHDVSQPSLDLTQPHHGRPSLWDVYNVYLLDFLTFSKEDFPSYLYEGADPAKVVRGLEHKLDPATRHMLPAVAVGELVLVDEEGEGEGERVRDVAVHVDQDHVGLARVGGFYKEFWWIFV